VITLTHTGIPTVLTTGWRSAWYQPQHEPGTEQAAAPRRRVPTNRSAQEFAREDRTGVLITRVPFPAKTSSNAERPDDEEVDETDEHEGRE
jgi:hypothetical protein